ncbi:helix-turn-helix transcriptional regulator [Streptomyces botrytidirepellens]|uniref:Helix-turn-helix domain-containing protein n=1 Tax=Streptomyces botrytidirepellens TaxID=2486417 RepID=A0A3M8VT52_9ACTN|nr:helix-turn-helix transcriptional regulator [Streptomyces botrytidirepellens]RNG19455.1 helix-turn-helix domain-containing protein [Streptomyces botrytidirepellens]
MARGLANFSSTELRAHRMNLYARPNAVSMTAEQLAEAVGATKAQILAYENGHRVPDPPRVRALARALRIHPWQLMNLDERNTWTLADFRRASGLRAEDVVTRLGISPKNYRRFETEGIVPSRRPQFIDEVAAAMGMPRQMVVMAIDRTPAVQRRQGRAFELVVAMAERYVPKAGPWDGPALTDPNLIELAAAYGRPVQRIRRVLTYELGELRQSQVRARRERVIADYDTDLSRQAGARHALNRWHEVFETELFRLPRRLESFHRTAQPSDVWQLLVDLFNVDALGRSDAGTWAVTTLLSKEPQVLPRYLVEQGSVEDVQVCRLSAPGANHVLTYAGLYAALYPGVRRPIRTGSRVKSRGGAGPETFTLPNRIERLTVPHPILENMRIVLARAKTTLPIGLSPTYELTVGANSLSAAPKGFLLPMDDPD